MDRIIALAFDANADKLTALVTVAGENGDCHACVYAYDLRGNDEPTAYFDPDWLPVDQYDADSVMSANGAFVALRTERIGVGGKTYHGAGVWDIGQGKWHHRFGGLEAMPHDIYAVTSTGDLVFTSRNDDPARDHRNGGPEWYDGLYVWDAATAPPEGVAEAKPDGNIYTDRNMVFNTDETRFAASPGYGYTGIYDTQTRTKLRDFARPSSIEESHYDNVWRMAFRPDGDALLVGYGDGAILEWDLRPAPPDAPVG